MKDFENTYLRGELITIDGKTYKARTSFSYSDTNYVLVDDNRFNFISLVNLDGKAIAISNYVSAKDLIIELSGNNKTEEKIIGKAIADGRRQADDLKAHIKVHGDTRSHVETAPSVTLTPLLIGELCYSDVDAPYVHSKPVLIDGWRYTIDSNFRVGLLKYLLVKNKFNLYSLFGLTGKKTKEMRLLFQGIVSIESTLKALSLLLEVPVNDVRVSRMSGIEQSKQAAKLANKKYKL